MPSTTTAESQPTAADPHTNNGQGNSGVHADGFARNGSSSFSRKTVEAVRSATEKFFQDLLHKTPQEAKQVTAKLTSSWEKDLELNSK